MMSLAETRLQELGGDAIVRVTRNSISSPLKPTKGDEAGAVAPQCDVQKPSPREHHVGPLLDLLLDDDQQPSAAATVQHPSPDAFQPGVEETPFAKFQPFDKFDPTSCALQAAVAALTEFNDSANVMDWTEPDDRCATPRSLKLHGQDSFSPPPAAAAGAASAQGLRSHVLAPAPLSPAARGSSTKKRPVNPRGQEATPTKATGPSHRQLHQQPHPGSRYPLNAPPPMFMGAPGNPHNLPMPMPGAFIHPGYAAMHPSFTAQQPRQLFRAARTSSGGAGFPAGSGQPSASAPAPGVRAPATSAKTMMPDANPAAYVDLRRGGSDPHPLPHASHPHAVCHPVPFHPHPFPQQSHFHMVPHPYAGPHPGARNQQQPGPKRVRAEAVPEQVQHPGPHPGPHSQQHPAPKRVKAEAGPEQGQRVMQRPRHGYVSHPQQQHHHLHPHPHLQQQQQQHHLWQQQQLHLQQQHLHLQQQQLQPGMPGVSLKAERGMPGASVKAEHCRDFAPLAASHSAPEALPSVIPPPRAWLPQAGPAPPGPPPHPKAAMDLHRVRYVHSFWHSLPGRAVPVCTELADALKADFEEEWRLQARRLGPQPLAGAGRAGASRGATELLTEVAAAYAAQQGSWAAAEAAAPAPARQEQVELCAPAPKRRSLSAGAVVPAPSHAPLQAGPSCGPPHPAPSCEVQSAPAPLDTADLDAFLDSLEDIVAEEL